MKPLQLIITPYNIRKEESSVQEDHHHHAVLCSLIGGHLLGHD